MINYPHQVQLAQFKEKMKAEGLPNIFIQTFHRYYEQLVSGDTGLISEEMIQPVYDLPDADTFQDSYYLAGEAALGKTAVIKLNGGLGTSMGLKKAKSLLAVKNDLTFLDIIARQVEEADMPLVLMNSFNTDQDSRDKLAPYKYLFNHQIPISFLQHKEPKVRQDDFGPVSWPDNPALEWCPPGHGDIYTALVTSGTLDALLAAGYEYAFVSNVDNLGAVVDLSILGFFAENEYPFMMEVADRTTMDRKGGHLARRHDGQLVLRESAQCPAEDQDAFQNIGRYKYFNTNNLWLNLPILKRVLVERNYQLGLPMIRNSKTVDPRDLDSTPVYQIETAMGSAIAVFEGAQAIRVPRSRFAPVKTTNDLLAVRSDVYQLTSDFRVVPNGLHAIDLDISLDGEHFKLMDDFNGRFATGAPSLTHCSRFFVEGDVSFGKGVVCRGVVEIYNQSDSQVHIKDGTILEGIYQF